MNPTSAVRAARATDCSAIADMIHGLAAYERLSDQCHVDADALALQLFGAEPAAEVLVAEAVPAVGGPARVLGFALYFPTFSTFLARPGLWLEDLYVEPDERGRGVGRALLSAVAGVAEARGCGRLEWAVLDWNTPAIGFYRSMGAHLLEDWTTCRVDGASLADLARRGAQV